MSRTALVAMALLLASGTWAEEAPRGRARPAGACTALAPVRDSIAAMQLDGEIGFASGRRALLSGVRLLRDEALAENVRLFLQGLRGKPAILAPLGSGTPDRWGRLSAHVTVEDGDEPLDLAGALVAPGLAVVDAGAGDALCRPALLAIEDRARREGKGAWAPGGAAGPLAAADGARLAVAAGRFAIVQGKVHSVGERLQRTYLDLGPRGAKAATITIPKRAWLRMADRGLKAATLRDRTIRARGVVEIWRGGPVIEVVAADMIELVEPGGAGTP